MRPLARFDRASEDERILPVLHCARKSLAVKYFIYFTFFVGAFAAAGARRDPDARHSMLLSADDVGELDAFTEDGEDWFSEDEGAGAGTASRAINPNELLVADLRGGEVPNEGVLKVVGGSGSFTFEEQDDGCMAVALQVGRARHAGRLRAVTARARARSRRP